MIKLVRPTCPNPVALKTDYKHKDNKEALRASTSSKCMYCESFTDHTYFGDVEHIVPKDIKPELKFEWTNLGYVCAKCNNAKQNKYDESLPIIDPYVEDPDNYLIASDAFIYAKQGNDKGELTILDLDLNRKPLVGRRQDHLTRINRTLRAINASTNQTLKNNALKEILNEANSNKEYSFVTKQLLSVHGILN